MVDSNSNYYDILGVAKQASSEEIRKAYKELAKQYHPDRLNGLAESEKERLTEKMKILTNAYTTLKDEDLRKEYDRRLLMGGSYSHQNPFYQQQNHNTRYYTYTTFRRTNRPAPSPLASLLNTLIFLGVLGLIIFLVIMFLSAAWPFILILLLLSWLRRASSR